MFIMVIIHIRVFTMIWQQNVVQGRNVAHVIIGHSVTTRVKGRSHELHALKLSIKLFKGLLAKVSAVKLFYIFLSKTGYYQEGVDRPRVSHTRHVLRSTGTLPASPAPQLLHNVFIEDHLCLFQEEWVGTYFL